MVISQKTNHQVKGGTGANAGLEVAEVVLECLVMQAKNSVKKGSHHCALRVDVSELHVQWIHGAYLLHSCFLRERDIAATKESIKNQDSRLQGHS